MEADIRAFSLISERTLDDRAVQELARGVAQAAVLGGEVLGSITRRESTLTFGDLLEPIDTHEADERSGVRFTITVADDPDMVLAILYTTESAAVALADIFFGGPGSGSERQITEIEARAISTSMGGVVAPIVAVLSGLEGFQVALHPVREAHLPAPKLVELALHLNIGETTIEAALFAPDPDGARVDLSSRDAMAETVKDMPVDVDIELASVEMAAADVQALADGDVIVFDAEPDAEAVARSGAQDLLKGHIGENSGRRFLQVTEVLVSS